ncbi:hypothetical protein, partial [Photorhabdus sp. RM126S]|uniref:hypothetical protein n=1 Tax=Photorhabdus sp. RM126S TaxID=3342826 RepID=UPI0036DE6A3F
MLIPAPIQLVITAAYNNGKVNVLPSTTTIVWQERSITATGFLGFGLLILFPFFNRAFFNSLSLPPVHSLKSYSPQQRIPLRTSPTNSDFPNAISQLQPVFSHVRSPPNPKL